MPKNLKLIRNIIYKLKREYGQKLTVYRMTQNDYSVTSGKVTKDYSVQSVKRAIVLPTKIERDFVYDLAFIAANKNFTYGGLFDTNQRVIIIDNRELTTDFVFNLNDHIVFDGNYYTLKTINIAEIKRATLLVTKELVGAFANEHISETVSDNLSVSEDV